MFNIVIAVDGTDLNKVSDLYEVYRKVGLTLDATISNMSTDDYSNARYDLEQCQELLDFLFERVEQELNNDNDE
mgnify:CR=1 FL=1